MSAASAVLAAAAAAENDTSHQTLTIVLFSVFVAATLGITIPTLCYLETLRPVNVCRLCVAEVEGARVLVPGCARASEPGMVVHTRSPRVVHSRRLVLELLASSVDLSTAPGLAELLAENDCAPERYGPPAPPSAARDLTIAGHHDPPDVESAATVAQPVKIDNELYVRDYGKCVLCYKCVEACGPDHQNTFAIAVKPEAKFRRPPGFRP